jgi:hypothetical protein
MWQIELMKKVEFKTKNVRAKPAKRKQPIPPIHPLYKSPTKNGRNKPVKTIGR